MFCCKVSDRVELRMYDHSHVEEVYAVSSANRDHIRLWLPWVDNMKGPEDTRAFIQKGLEQFAANNGFQCGIWEDNKYIGGAGFHWINRNNNLTEIGYWLTKESQGKGIMTACCRKLVDHAFDVWKLNKVEIRAAVANHRSRAVPQRLGFTEEGTIRQVSRIGEIYHDLVTYGMLASEWEKQREKR